MPNELRNKVVVITGASGGIGRAAVHAFNKAGAKIVLVSRRREVLSEIASGLDDALVVQADLSSAEDVLQVIERTVSHFGRIDILVNNAASIIVSPSGSVSADDLVKAFRTNLVGPVIATQQAIQYMRAQGGGHIINIGSPGFMMGIPYYAPYVCSKAAFSAWTRTIQAEWKGSNIRISEYFPGYIKTDSKPESRIGEIEQDLLMNSNPSFFARLFTSPGSPEKVAGQLVRLAMKPRTLVYSDFSTWIGAYLSNISWFRLAIATRMAKTARNKKNLGVFNQ